jgi:hypothetical protein
MYEEFVANPTEGTKLAYLVPEALHFQIVRSFSELSDFGDS